MRYRKGWRGVTNSKYSPPAPPSPYSAPHKHTTSHSTQQPDDSTAYTYPSYYPLSSKLPQHQPLHREPLLHQHSRHPQEHHLVPLTKTPELRWREGRQSSLLSAMSQDLLVLSWRFELWAGGRMLVWSTRVYARLLGLNRTTCMFLSLLFPSSIFVVLVYPAMR